jgi:DNA-binding response OmpR family regulator
MKILLVEDDPDITQALLNVLRLEPFEVFAVGDGHATMRTIQSNTYDMVLLDLAIPKRSGDEVLKHIRDANMQLPVIIITATADIATKVRLFELGADDVLVKPFACAELVARIKSVLRKQKIEVSSKLSYHDILLDLKKHEASRNGQPIVLREKEIRILEYFLMHPEQVLTREMIMNYVWGPSVERIANVVDVHIHYLRERIDKPYDTPMVKTVSNVGYKLCK